MDHVLEEDLEDSVSLLIDEPTDAFDATPPVQAPDQRLSDALDIVTEHFVVALYPCQHLIALPLPDIVAESSSLIGAHPAAIEVWHSSKLVSYAVAEDHFCHFFMLSSTLVSTISNDEIHLMQPFSKVVPDQSKKAGSLTVFAFNHLVRWYARCEGVGDARRLFDEMPQRNVFSWTSLMVGYVHASPVSSFERRLMIRVGFGVLREYGGEKSLGGCIENPRQSEELKDQGKLHSGHEYVDAVVGADRLLVDAGFRSEFEIVVVASEAAWPSLKKNDLHVPPWRRHEYMGTKWFSAYHCAAAVEAARVHGDQVVLCLPLCSRRGRSRSQGQLRRGSDNGGNRGGGLAVDGGASEAKARR
ncbi:hypothetical protein ZIOFF_049936 [Zingiber officinale]|uniref:Pentatricopeptide repeat-containing protein n=1 Tax=Zingiber officinale TaxID=94328 RepID=A0A8J5KR09_ZINOF|nr:hypothetical protein ZIOFF_049936 [Zingiber officinale]